MAYLASATNLGCLMNVGSYDNETMGARCWSPEIAHVWRGKNSIFALSYTVSSVVSQCTG